MRSTILVLIMASSPLVAGLDAEDIFELDRAGVPAWALVPWIRAGGAEGIDSDMILDMQELGTSDAVVAELMRLEVARRDPGRPARAILVIQNRTGAPIGVHVEGREIRLEAAPNEDGPRLGDGDEARIPVDAVRHEVLLDGRPTGLGVTPVADDTRLEVLARVEGGHGLRARVERGHRGLFEGPLLQPPRDPDVFVDEAEVWSCQAHSEVKRPRRGVCPTCGRPLVKRRDPNTPPSIPPFMGGDDPQDWDPSVPLVFVCPAHPELWARAPGKCPLCGVEMQPLK